MLVPPPSGLPARPKTPPTDFKIFDDAGYRRPMDPHEAEQQAPRQPQALLAEAITYRKRMKYPNQAHDNYLLKSPLARDFALNTSEGVVFKVHVTMILGPGRPKMLQEYIFPGGVPNPSPPTCVDLPPSFLPVIIDRLVNFLYTGSYQAKNIGGLQHATHIPEEGIAWPEIDRVTFHIHMLSLAEELEYPALYHYAQNQLTDAIAKMPCPPDLLANVIDAAFSPLGSDMRIGKDKEGWVQNLVVAGTIVQESKHYQSDHKSLLRVLLPAEKYEAFWRRHGEVKMANLDIIPMQREKLLPTTRVAKNRQKNEAHHAARVQKNRPLTKKGPREMKEAERKALDILHVREQKGHLWQEKIMQETKDEEARSEAILNGLGNLGLG